jgi:hypothetical protein
VTDYRAPYGQEKGYKASIRFGERILNLCKVWRKAMEPPYGLEIL